MVTITFRPQAWIDDYAVDCDPEGETTFEVEEEILRGLEPHTYEADELREHKNAPQWVKDWPGPFEVEWPTDPAPDQSDWS
jgi:hypothetical protein